MTTITIENSTLDFPGKFHSDEELFEFLITSFDDKTFLVRTSVEDFNEEEKKAWEKHKLDGYSDFTDFRG